MADQEKLVKIFEYALNQEQTGMSFFQTSLGRMGVGAAKSAFEKLVEEERKHILFISSILEDLRNKGDIDVGRVKGMVISPTNYFDDRARSEFLEQCVSGSMIPDVTVFNVAWLIEKDLSEFYGKMAEQTEGQARQSFQMLAAWERGHEKFFREYRDKLSKTYSSMPWGG